MKLETLFAGVEYTGTLPQGDVTLVTQDSRRAGPGAVFVCVQRAIQQMGTPLRKRRWRQARHAL